MKKKILNILILTILFSCGNSNTQSKLHHDKYYYPELNKFYSEKPLGANIEDNNIVFRLFAPRATTVRLVLFETHDAVIGNEYLMERKLKRMLDV